MLNDVVKHYWSHANRARIKRGFHMFLEGLKSVLKHLGYLLLILVCIILLRILLREIKRFIK